LPNIKSAEKRMRTSRVRAERNRQTRSRLRTAVKRARQEEDVEKAEAAFRHASALLDRAADRDLLHHNKAARTKSQLAAHVATLREKAEA